MNDRFSAQLRLHLLETANERPADGQLAAVVERVAVTSQRPSRVARLTWFPGRVGSFPSTALRFGLVAAALVGATMVAALFVSGGPSGQTIFEGQWTSTDPADASTQFLTVAAGTSPAVRFVDEFATGEACVADAVKVFTADGSGAIDGDRLHVVWPDGGGCGLRTVHMGEGTYVHDEATDTLVDSQKLTWARVEGAVAPPTPSSTADPTPSPSPSSSTAGAVDFPNLTTTFVSPRNGFSIKHPDRVALTPATNLGFGDDGFDVVETGLAAVFKGASTEMPRVENGFLVGEPSDISIDEWVDSIHDSPGGCVVPRSEQAEITIDGQPGRIAECANRIEATVVAGGRLYLFTLSHDRGDARAVFDAFVATIELTPETAVDFPAMTTTFVSPTYGYAFGYIDRGGLEPATELWDPANQQFRPVDHDGRFDFVESGYGAGFWGASTEILEGVSIDAWVDAHASPGGCGVPRSQQAEITIDGQSGRIAECTERIEATVVAGGRLYLFLMGHVRSDARAWFDTWVATIDLTPETATVP